jgi:hypothetical protein
MRTRPPVIGSLLLFAVWLASTAFAQTNWTRTYGGPYPDQGYCVQQTSDGGFILTGWTESDSTRDDVYLIRTDAHGDTLWTRTYGGPERDRGYSVQQTSDGGYVIAGYTSSFGGDDDYVYLIKTGARGDTIWTRTYGGPDGNRGYSVQQTSDGGYIITGSFGSYDYARVYLIKTDAHGDTLWTRMYGKEGDEGRSVQQTTDGGYIIVSHHVPDSDDALLIKTNGWGDTMWTRNCGRTYVEGDHSLQQTSDGGYVVAGSVWVSDAYNEVHLVKTNASGDMLWTRTYGGTGYDEANSIRQTADGGYIVTGFTASFGAGGTDVYIIKTNASGDTLWSKTFGGTGGDLGYSVQQNSDGGYIAAGVTSPYGSGNDDVYLIRTDANVNVAPVTILSPPGSVESGLVYVPTAVVRNLGLTPAVFPVTLDIGAGYAETIQETLASGGSDTVVFPSWIAEPEGPVKVTCFTSLAGDEYPTNDTTRDSIQVLPPPIHDVGAVAIVSPSGSVRAGDTVIPKARIRNFGNRQERYFDVRFHIGTNYNEKVNVANPLPAGSTAEITFAPWVAEAGNWAASCSTMLGSDVDSANDKASSSVLVVPQSLSIAPDQSDRIEAGTSRTYRFYALIQGDTGAVVELARPSAPPGWSVRLCDATGAEDLTDTDGDGMPDLGYVAPGESGWFSLDVTAPSGAQGDTASLGQGVFLVAGHVGDRPDIADTAVLTLTLVPELSIHNFPNPFTDHTAFVIGLPEDGEASLTVYTRNGARVCRVLANADLSAGVHLVRWDGVNDNGRTNAPGTYEYLLDYVHAGKTDRIRKRLVLTRQ